MKRCLITYGLFEGEGDYSERGLKLLDRRLDSLSRLAYSAAEQYQQAIDRAGKMSIQGVQIKLSAVLRVSEGRFELVDKEGRFILKPPNRNFAEMPANEDLSMRLAAAVGITVPLHGLVRARDDSLTYFVKRFDRVGRERLPLEDFAQLSGEDRDTKHASSMEKVAAVVDRFCTFPAIERVKLFERTLFSFLIGNEDMHLKNFSLISERERVSLSPAYDMVNSSIALGNPTEEMALPIRGKKSRLTRNDLFDYYATERLGLNKTVVHEVARRFGDAFSRWDELIATSFLSNDSKAAYTALLSKRREQLKL